MSVKRKRKRKTQHVKFVQINPPANGYSDWYRVEQYECCCDCYLVHKTKHRVHIDRQGKVRLFAKTRRLESETRYQRKLHGFRVPK